MRRLIDDGDLEAFRMRFIWRITRGSVRGYLSTQRALPPSDDQIEALIASRRRTHDTRHQITDPDQLALFTYQDQDQDQEDPDDD